MSTHTKGKLIAVEVGVSDMGPNGVPVYELIAEGGHKRIAERLYESDAARLALCWDTHDQLLEALQSAEIGLANAKSYECLPALEQKSVCDALNQVRAAIKAAKGEA